jgi:hypothetical protein
MVGTSKSGNRFDKEYGLLLFLKPELLLGLAKVQVQKQVGRSYAGLLALTVGFHELGAIDDETFTFFEKRYCEKLVQEPLQKPLSTAELMEKRRMETKDSQLKMMLVQWEIHKSESAWRLKIVSHAEKYPQLESAKRVMELCRQADQEALASSEQGNDDKLERAVGHKPPKVEGEA